MIDRLRQIPWLRRGIFLGANLAAATAIYILAIEPIAEFFSARDARIADQRAVLARLTAIAQQEPGVIAADAAAAEDAKRGELLTGPNDGVMTADLQTRLKTMGEQAGARLRSVQGLPAKTTEQVKYIGARLEILGTHRAVQRALHGIEGGRPYLFITAATLKPAPASAGPAAREEPMIEARLDVFGAVQIEAQSR